MLVFHIRIFNPADLSVFYSMFYQNGGVIYNNKGTRSLLDSETGVSAFKHTQVCSIGYGLEPYYDFVSRSVPEKCLWLLQIMKVITRL